MIVDLTPMEAIHLEGAMRDAYKKHVAHYAEKGCPGFMKQVVEERLDTQ